MKFTPVRARRSTAGFSCAAFSVQSDSTDIMRRPRSAAIVRMWVGHASCVHRFPRTWRAEAYRQAV